MKTQYYFYPRYSKYKVMDTPFDSLKSSSFFQQYQNNYQKIKKPIKLQKLSKELISYDSIEPKNSISKNDIPITSGSDASVANAPPCAHVVLGLSIIPLAALPISSPLNVYHLDTDIIQLKGIFLRCPEVKPR